MTTSKKRLNITLSKETRVYLKKLALRDNVPEATKASDLLEMALDIEEDAYFSPLADTRAQKSKKTQSHDAFWSKAL